jgi:uncharacterized damage-inducible protein DinB
MANYNQWMNENLYKASSSLTAVELLKERGAFFGSVSGTLNHILVGDTIWLKRFASHPGNFKSLDSVRNTPMPSALTEILHVEFAALQHARQQMDSKIIEFADEVAETDYEIDLTYNNTKGIQFCKNFGSLVQHFFNHQTHHRGQLTTLLAQLGLDCGITDLLVRIPDAEGI